MRHTTFRQLEIFEAIARLGSFTKAADELHLTQPTVSMQIKKLTDTVGAPLLEQVGKKVQLTDTGRELVKAAREIFSTLDDFAMSVAERQGMKKGRLKLMAITSASYFAPRLLGEFSRLYPGIEVALRVSNREKLLASMADNPDDLYILGRPPEDIDVIATPFLENPIVVLAPPDHPLAGQKGISLKRLAQENWLMREAGSGTRIAIEKLFSNKGLELKPRLELGSNEAIKQAILSGLGISALSAHTLALDQVGQFAVLDAEGFPIMSHWYVVYPAARPPSLVARTFLDFLHRQEERIVSAPKERVVRKRPGDKSP
jgi:molybdate transport repressor ModE-like protein